MIFGVIGEIISTYQGHPSVKQMTSTFGKLNTPEAIQFTFEHTNPLEVQKLLKNIDTKKAAGFDKISPKLVKLSTGILRTPFLLL